MGVWFKVLEALIAMGYSTGGLSLDKVAVDSTTVKGGLYAMTGGLRGRRFM
jgi:hypothetical protein